MLKKDIAEKLKFMHLEGMLESWDENMEIAKEGKQSFESWFISMINNEYERKQGVSLERRIARAKIKEILVMATFPFGQQPKLDKRKILAAYDSFDYIDKHRNMVWVGPTGSGKTGLATAFLIQALEKGYTGKFVDFNQLIRDLYKSTADHSEDKILKPLIACDCLVIDELGYINVEANQVGQFFEILHKRHKRSPTLITTNLGFEEWGKFLKNDHLTAALIDRLTSNCEVFNLAGCKSIRPTK